MGISSVRRVIYWNVRIGTLECRYSYSSIYLASSVVCFFIERRFCHFIMFVGHVTPCMHWRLISRARVRLVECKYILSISCEGSRILSKLIKVASCVHILYLGVYHTPYDTWIARTSNNTGFTWWLHERYINQVHFPYWEGQNLTAVKLRGVYRVGTYP